MRFWGMLSKGEGRKGRTDTLVLSLKRSQRSIESALRRFWSVWDILRDGQEPLSYLLGKHEHPSGTLSVSSQLPSRMTHTRVI